MVGGMPLSFVETMSGTYEPIDSPGTRHPFRFDVEVHAPSLLRHLRDGGADLTGTIDAPGLATHAPLSGRIVIRPIGGRFIRYDFAFTGDDGKLYTFAGQKDIEWLSLVKTWTTLPGEIRDGDRVVATCDARFDLKDGPAFMRSFRFFSTGLAAPPHRRSR
jgi:hypothetical protein